MATDKTPKTISVTHVNIRLSISFMIIKLILIEVIATVLLVLFFFPVSPLRIPFDIMIGIFSLHTILFSLLISTKIYLSFYVIFEWLNEYYEITPTCIIYKEGFLFKKEQHYNFRHIRSIGVKQGLIGSLLNFGTIHLYDWYNRKDVYLYQIHNPMRYFHVIEQLVPAIHEEQEMIRDHLIEREDEALISD